MKNPEKEVYGCDVSFGSRVEIEVSLIQLHGADNHKEDIRSDNFSKNAYGALTMHLSSDQHYGSASSNKDEKTTISIERGQNQ